jgi:hypothetical protein
MTGHEIVELAKDKHTVDYIDELLEAILDSMGEYQRLEVMQKVLRLK